MDFDLAFGLVETLTSGRRSELVGALWASLEGELVDWELDMSLGVLVRAGEWELVG